QVEFVDPWCGTAAAELMIVWKVEVDRGAQIDEPAVMPVGCRGRCLGLRRRYAGLARARLWGLTCRWALQRDSRRGQAPQQHASPQAHPCPPTARRRRAGLRSLSTWSRREMVHRFAPCRYASNVVYQSLVPRSVHSGESMAYKVKKVSK